MKPAAPSSSPSLPFRRARLGRGFIVGKKRLRSLVPTSRISDSLYPVTRPRKTDTVEQSAHGQRRPLTLYHGGHLRQTEVLAEEVQRTRAYTAATFAHALRATFGLFSIFFDQLKKNVRKATGTDTHACSDT